MAKHIALITGGMGGLGESISTKMHDAGFNVVVTHSPGNKNAAAWVADYKGRGYNFAAFGVDVADYDSCQACLAKVRGGEEGRDGQHHLAGLHPESKKKNKIKKFSKIPKKKKKTACLTRKPPIVPFAFSVFAHIALAMAVCDSDGDELDTVPVQPEGLLVGPLSMTPLNDLTTGTHLYPTADHPRVRRACRSDGAD